jgi:4-amino-4-deoxy-L-arabinose transferase-like glycosyltransferase
MLLLFATAAQAMPSLSAATSSIDAPAPGWAQTKPHPYLGWTVIAVTAITAARLVWLAVQSADLYPDEAQYWFWAQHPAFGYYSKPPLVAWVIALTTSLLGDSEFAIRSAAPLLHAGVAGLVYAVGARLYDRRTGFWSAIAYASLPGVSVSAFVISTDAVLMPCWAAAFYAFVRAREPDGERWWIAVGVAAGLGLLAKYAMMYWLLSACGYLLLVRAEARQFRFLLAASGIAFLIYLPNLWWNWSNGFVSYLHVRDNAELSGTFFHPLSLLEFFGSQFGIFGPLFFAGLLMMLVQPRLLREPRALLLASFAVPALAMMLGISLLSRAQPNWAAPTYVSAAVLVVAWALQGGWNKMVRFSIALNLAAAIALFAGTDALAAAGIEMPAKYDPLHRLRGWRSLGERVGAELAAHPGLTLMADDRELLAALIYYVRPHPLDAVEWCVIPGVTDQWRLVNNINGHRGQDFLAVTQHRLVAEMRAEFDELSPLATISTASGPGGGRGYVLYIARGYHGAVKGG